MKESLLAKKKKKIVFVVIATPPQVTSHPARLTIAERDGNVCLSVIATGTAPLSYQWQKDEVNLTDGGRIKGASTSTLSITAVQKSDEGGYTCEVTNTAGTVTSKTSMLNLGWCIIYSIVGGVFPHVYKSHFSCLPSMLAT